MITLLSLTQYEDNLLAARWLDDAYGLHFEFNALHDADGRPVAVNLEGRAPALTADQLASAAPFVEPAPAQHPAYELAALGTAVQPTWANRYQKAAQLVEAGHVRLTGPDTAVVTGSSDSYTLTGDKCGCKWSQFNATPCSHYLAVRMARALAQPILPTTEAEKEAACAARRQANKDAMELRIAARGENIYYKQRRQARRDGDGARQWARMAYANGRGTIPAHIYDQATGK